MILSELKNECPVDLSVEGRRSFIVTRHQSVTATAVGSLMQDGGLVSEALERLCLSLAAAGFPIHDPQFRRSLQSTCERMADRM